MNRQPIRERQQLARWSSHQPRRPDYLDSDLEWILAALCVIALGAVISILMWGGR